MNTRRSQPAALAQKHPQPERYPQLGQHKAARWLGRLGTLDLRLKTDPV